MKISRIKNKMFVNNDELKSFRFDLANCDEETDCLTNIFNLLAEEIETQTGLLVEKVIYTDSDYDDYYVIYLNGKCGDALADSTCAGTNYHLLFDQNSDPELVKSEILRLKTAMLKLVDDVIKSDYEFTV